MQSGDEQPNPSAIHLLCVFGEQFCNRIGTDNMTDIAAKHGPDSDEADELVRKIKRSKKDSDQSETTEESESQNVLSDFKTSKILSESAREKTIFVHGKVIHACPILTRIRPLK